MARRDLRDNFDKRPDNLPPKSQNPNKWDDQEYNNRNGGKDNFGGRDTNGGRDGDRYGRPDNNFGGREGDRNGRPDDGYGQRNNSKFAGRGHADTLNDRDPNFD